MRWAPHVRDVPVLATVLHLVCAEWLAIWSFWLGYYALLTDTTAYMYLWYTDIKMNSTDASACGVSSNLDSVGDYVFCVQTEIQFASWSLDLNWKGSCVNLQGGYNLLGIANIACLTLCVSLVGGSILAVVIPKHTDICTGKYLAAKFDFEKTRFARWLWLLLLTCVASCFACTLYVCGSTLNSKVFGQVLEAWFFYNSVDIVMVVFSAYALLPGWSPRFDYQSSDFKALRFRRTWRQVFASTSEGFARDLEEAILLARSGSFKRLEAFLEVPRMAHVWQCDFDEGSDSDSTDTIGREALELSSD